MNDSILIRGLLDEDFVQYKKPSMFIGTSICDWKCCKDAGCDISMCQNSPLARFPAHRVLYQYLYNRYINNPITTAIVVGGLEPFFCFDELHGLIWFFREKGCQDDFVIYTGYNVSELTQQIISLKAITKLFPGDIIVKFGRYIPNDAPVEDKILGVTLASSNQYAERL